MSLTGQDAPSPQSGLSGTDRNLKPFSYDVLLRDSRNFWPDSIMGESNLGLVFKGCFDEQSLEATKPGMGTIFSVERLNEESDQGDKEWLAEIDHLSKLNHPNLVKLIGYCLEDNRRLLIYEFMNRGSLEYLLFRKSDYFLPLSWNLRIKIVVGAAKGLSYIHNQEPKMICCDITSRSILVDSDYNAKLSNLLWREHENSGPDRLIVDELDAIENVPRVFVEGCSSLREEICSFGVVLSEVFTGKRNIDKNRPANERIQVEFIRPYLDSKRRIKTIIDDCIDGQYTMHVAIRFGMIMKRCLSIDPRGRPTADEVVKALEEIQDLQESVPSPIVGKVSHRRPLISAATSTSANVQES